ncbi:MAG: hypothetical protein F4139_00660 [Gemmatimonadetes bacterium]|nr:hypothetical protein [Gemmatimonadota bacterium]MYA65615.1 hypothetical protein [Gemmatimonadota bacterium]MYB99503.1 hypothetical protein [Gemmatimonadota bacterium]MYH51439.1 hypothetical protein [Gemmatimonadota bacterium]MYI46158.1 hypothetical protein [Gemmatimonadota bacterium]
MQESTASYIARRVRELRDSANDEALNLGSPESLCDLVAALDDLSADADRVARETLLDVVREGSIVLWSIEGPDPDRERFAWFDDHDRAVAAFADHPKATHLMANTFAVSLEDSNLVMERTPEDAEALDAREVDRIVAGEPLDPGELMAEVRGYGHDVPTLLDIAEQWDEKATESAATYGQTHWWAKEARQRAAAFRLVAAEIDFGAVYGSRAAVQPSG